VVWRTNGGRPTGSRAALLAVAPSADVLGPTTFGISPELDLPLGSEIRLAEDVELLTPETLLGGSPPRFLRLSPPGAAALEELRGGLVTSQPAAALARRLTDTGLAEARPGPVPPRLTLTVVVPVRDRPQDLDRCLRSIGRSHPVMVVDDGSDDAAAVVAVCADHGAELVRRNASGGPAAARNTALDRVESDLVAFVDSDCRVPEGWIDRLVGHFADPLAVAVAPRVVASRRGGPRSSLDMGTRPATVIPGGPVPYVPTAAVVARRAPLGTGFDASLRYGEDVDLVWRLRSAGWRVRYDPSVEVEHDDPPTLGGRLRRRFDYGTSVGPLALRHPGDLDHLVLAPGPAVTVGALATVRPLLATASAATVALSLARPLRRHGVGWSQIGRLFLLTLVNSWIGLGRWCGQFAWPVLPAVLVAPGGRSRRRRAARRTAAVLLILTPVLRDLVRSEEPPSSWPGGLVSGLLAEAAYGAGAATGCWRARVLSPILPSVRRSAGQSR
jgi:mycofactocin glycosyltransferase